MVCLSSDGGDVGLYHIETSPLIYGANQWTGFYMIGTSVMKELMLYPLHLKFVIIHKCWVKVNGKELIPITNNNQVRDKSFLAVPLFNQLPHISQSNFRNEQS